MAAVEPSRAFLCLQINPQAHKFQAAVLFGAAAFSLRGAG